MRMHTIELQREPARSQVRSPVTPPFEAPVHRIVALHPCSVSMHIVCMPTRVRCVVPLRSACIALLQTAAISLLIGALFL